MTALKLENPSSYVASASISQVADKHYLLYITSILASKTDYVSKTQRGAKMLFAIHGFKGAKWKQF